MKGLKAGSGVVTRLKVRTAAIGLAAISITAALLAATATQAQASASMHLVNGLHVLTTNAASATSCTPKVDEELDGVWGNTCGDGTLLLYNDYVVDAIRSPSAPYHRIWFHEYYDNSGLTACFYSEDNDIYPGDYVAEYGAWVETPGNIQVSANTSPC